jgi:hypothetical protein
MKYILYATDNTSDVNTKLPTSPIDAHIDNLNPPLSQVDNIKNDIDTNNSAPSVPQIVNIDTTFANIIIDDNILKDEATQIKKFPIKMLIHILLIIFSILQITILLSKITNFTRSQEYAFYNKFIGLERFCK